MRAIVIGFPKSGTSTIHKACSESGLKSAHWRIQKGFCGSLIYGRYLEGQDPFTDFKDYDVISQADVCLPKRKLNFWPNLDLALLLKIRQLHPDCLFILNVREPIDLISSFSRWGDLRKRLTLSDIIGLPRNFGAEDSHLINWIENHYSACRQAFISDKRFIELNVADPLAPTKLSEALGVDIRWWGVANKNKKVNNSLQV